MKTTTVSIVIPTYNERDNILAIIPAIKRVTSPLSRYRFEIVIVDDNSPDETGKLTKKIFSKDKMVRVFVRTNEHGLGTAIKLGIEKASGEIIIGMDADFNHDPECIPHLLEKLTGSQLAIASRFISGGGMDDHLRYYGTLLFNLLLSLLFGFPSTDNASGYYAIRKKDLEKLGLGRIYYGYGDYHLRLVYFAKSKRYKIAETPVVYQKRPFGKSKSNLLEMAVSYSQEAIRLWRMTQKRKSDEQ